MKVALLRSPSIVVGGMALAGLLGGGILFPGILTTSYLVQNLQIASILGVVALGSLCVIILGHVDLSIPWTMTGAAIMATSVGGISQLGQLGASSPWAIPSGLLIGVCIGVVNGIGVAVLRVPAMIWTLGMNAVILGLCIFVTGGFAPAGEASATMRLLSTGRTLGLPNAAFLWFTLCLAILALLHWTTFGRAFVAVGNGERAAFLAGVRTRGVIVTVFAFAGVCSALGGLMLAGYANRAYQSMGDPFLLPAFGAVVIGGTSIRGGTGSIPGMMMGVVFMTLLTSILSIVQIPESERQIIYGSVILGTLLFYGQARRKAN